jgi:hypothetical protein
MTIDIEDVFNVYENKVVGGDRPGNNRARKIDDDYRNSTAECSAFIALFYVFREYRRLLDQSGSCCLSGARRQKGAFRRGASRNHNAHAPNHTDRMDSTTSVPSCRQTRRQSN